MQSKISYTATGEVQSWGFEVQPSHKQIVDLEHLLWSSSTTTEIQTLIPSSKKPVDVIVDYLYFLKKHMMERMKGIFGELFLRVTPIDWVCTVPV